MFDPDAIERMRAMQRDWEANELREFLERQPESRPEYRTGSLLPVERVYTPVDVADTALEALGLPGRYRSEEHTSELQSRLHLVCRLLLEKKKKKPYVILPRGGDERYSGIQEHLLTGLPSRGLAES